MFQPVKISQVDTPLHTLLYGKTGSGKTTTATSFSNPEEVLLLNTDGGQSSITHRPIEALTINHENSLQIVEFLTKQFSKTKAQRVAPYDKYKYIVLDSISALSEDIIEQSRWTNGERAEFLTYKQWNVMSDAIIRLIDAIMASTDLTLILIAGSQETVADGVTSIKPMVSPALWNKLTFRVSNLWYTVRGRTGMYNLVLSERDGIQAKIRNPLFSNAVKNHNVEVAKKLFPDWANRMTSPVGKLNIEETFIVQDPHFNTLDFLFQMYKDSVK